MTLKELLILTSLAMASNTLVLRLKAYPLNESVITHQVNDVRDTNQPMSPGMRHLTWWGWGREEDDINTETTTQMLIYDPIEDDALITKKPSRWRSWLSNAKEKISKAATKVKNKLSEAKEDYNRGLSIIGSATKDGFVKAGSAIKLGAKKVGNATVSAGKAIKKGAKKLGSAVKKGFQKIRLKFSGSGEKFKIFANRIKEKVELGDEKAILLMKKLGIHITLSDNKISESHVEDRNISVTEVLRNEGMLSNKSASYHTAVEEPENLLPSDDDDDDGEIFHSAEEYLCEESNTCTDAMEEYDTVTASTRKPENTSNQPTPPTNISTATTYSTPKHTTILTSMTDINSPTTEEIKLLKSSTIDETSSPKHMTETSFNHISTPPSASARTESTLLTTGNEEALITNKIVPSHYPISHNNEAHSSSTKIPVSDIVTLKRNLTFTSTEVNSNPSTMASSSTIESTTKSGVNNKATTYWISFMTKSISNIDSDNHQTKPFTATSKALQTHQSPETTDSTLSMIIPTIISTRSLPHTGKAETTLEIKSTSSEGVIKTTPSTTFETKITTQLNKLETTATTTIPLSSSGTTFEPIIITTPIITSETTTTTHRTNLETTKTTTPLSTPGITTSATSTTTSTIITDSLPTTTLPMTNYETTVYENSATSSKSHNSETAVEEDPYVPPPFPDVFSDFEVHDRLKEFYDNGDFSHAEMIELFNFDPDNYEYYDYDEY